MARVKDKRKKPKKKPEIVEETPTSHTTIINPPAVIEPSFMAKNPILTGGLVLGGLAVIGIGIRQVSKSIQEKRVKKLSAVSVEIAGQSEVPLPMMTGLMLLEAEDLSEGKFDV